MLSEADVRALIHDVQDPCSVALGTPLGIEEMGLLQEIAIDDRRVTVTLQLTSPMCMMFVHFVREIERRLLEHSEVETVRVEVSHDFEWTPAAMTTQARQRLLDNRVTAIGHRTLEKSSS